MGRQAPPVHRARRGGPDGGQLELAGAPIDPDATDRAHYCPALDPGGQLLPFTPERCAREPATSGAQSEHQTVPALAIGASLDLMHQHPPVYRSTRREAGRIG